MAWRSIPSHNDSLDRGTYRRMERNSHLIPPITHKTAVHTSGVQLCSWQQCDRPSVVCCCANQTQQSHQNTVQAPQSSKASTIQSYSKTAGGLTPSIPAGSSAKERLELIEQMHRRSQAALLDSQAAAPRLVDARMYAAAMQSQRKTSEKLSEANVYISFLQAKVAKYDEDLQAASDLIKKTCREFGTTGRLAESAAAAVQFGVDKQDAIKKINQLKERLATLEKALIKEREQFAVRVPQKVPITWVGAASDVRLVGSFDNWSRGIELSGPDGDGQADSVLRTFEATVSLLPGKYQVKFLVDNEWRLAPDWPSEQDEQGETNNILEVK